MPIKMSGPVGGPSRRQVMAGLGAGAAAIATGGTRAVAADGALKVGFISPRTGPLGGFGQTDGYVIDVVRKALAKGFARAATSNRCRTAPGYLKARRIISAPTIALRCSR